MKKESLSLLTILRNVVCATLVLLVLLVAPTGWLCVYFDDYLVLTEVKRYPTGYVRYTTTEERRMLNQMAEDYDVDPVYILDMYRYGKVSWILDTMLRLGICAIIAVIILNIRNLLRKHKINCDRSSQ